MKSKSQERPESKKSAIPAQKSPQQAEVVEVSETIPQGKELEELRKQAAERDEYLKSFQRAQADFLNYQKRTRRDKEEWEKYKSEDILQQLLSAFDNIDRVLKIKCESQEARCLLDGINLTKKEIVRILEKNGVTQIKTVGEKFDPARHEAVMVVDDENQSDNTVVEEINPGYLLHDRVLRPAQVKVVKRKSPEPVKNSGNIQPDEQDKKDFV